jgi:hypothetical protein
MLAICGGSSLDQQTNNVTLWNLVEQVNIPPDAPAPPPGAVLPLEVHAYFELEPHEISRSFEVRFVLLAASGLETCTDAFKHRSVTPRYRTRTMGLPLPPVTGQYTLRVDFRSPGADDWHRDAASWPIAIVEAQRKPAVVH